MIDLDNVSNHAVQTLCNAIVWKAVDDYRGALRGRGFSYMNPEQACTELEAFFRSQWMSMLTELDGELLIERLQQEPLEEKRPLQGKRKWKRKPKTESRGAWMMKNL